MPAAPLSAAPAHWSWSAPSVEFGPKHADRLPEGLRYVTDFVSPEEEAELVEVLQRGDWLTHLIRAQQFFGLVYYQTRHDLATLQPGTPRAQAGRSMDDLPGWLIPRLVSTGVFPRGHQEINQVAANDYRRTVGIAAHVEDVVSFGPNLATLSLLAPVTITLSVADEEKNSREEPGDGIDHGNWVKVLLEPRSLLVLQGESRYRYRHGIRRSRLIRLRDGSIYKREEDYHRMSLTFRELLDTRRKLPLHCPISGPAETGANAEAAACLASGVSSASGAGIVISPAAVKATGKTVCKGACTGELEREGDGSGTDVAAGSPAAPSATATLAVDVVGTFVGS